MTTPQNIIAEICHLLCQAGRLYDSQKNLRWGHNLVAQITEHLRVGSVHSTVQLHYPEGQKWVLNSLRTLCWEYASYLGLANADKSDKSISTTKGNSGSAARDAHIVRGHQSKRNLRIVCRFGLIMGKRFMILEWKGFTTPDIILNYLPASSKCFVSLSEYASSAPITLHLT